MNLPQHIVASCPNVPVEAVLQLIESTRLSGVLQATNGVYMRVAEGAIVKAIVAGSTDPADAVRALMTAERVVVRFRAVRGVPVGRERASITGLLMAIASQLDEAEGSDTGARCAG